MLPAHSLTEARLYLKITACQECDPKSGARQIPNRPVGKSGIAGIVHVSGHCPSCSAEQELEFTIDPAEPVPASERPPPINQTETRSQIIDVGQWLTLSQLFIEESRSEPDRSRARILHLQAAQCLDEALKFYDDPDNDLPPQDAFFCASSRRRFRESPEQFSRSRLIGEKSKLPVTF